MEGIIARKLKFLTRHLLKKSLAGMYIVPYRRHCYFLILISGVICIVFCKQKKTVHLPKHEKIVCYHLPARE